MIIEMRTYKTTPGMRSRFLEIFHSKSIPAHREIGIKILGPFNSVEDPDKFFVMRGFPDLASLRVDESKVLRRRSVEGRVEERPAAHVGKVMKSCWWKTAKI